MTRTQGGRVLGTGMIREAFPALGREHGGRPVAYFDGPGGTQVPRVVGEALTDYLFQHNANTHWAFPTSVETDRILAEARGAVADLLNARPSEVAFGQNMTSLTFHLSRGIGRNLGPGDEVVVTLLDHQANVAPWKALAKERGVTVREVWMDPETLTLDMASLERAIGPRTKVVAIGAASNAFGTVSDVGRAATLAHDVGALVFVDAVHYAPHFLVDVKALGCDFLACSAYKFYGPHVGILYGREELILGLDAPKLRPAPETSPERLETGTQNHEGIAATGATVEFLASLASGGTRRERLAATYEALEERTAALADRLRAGLKNIRGVKVYGPPEGTPRTSTVAFAVEGVPSREVAEGLAGRGVFVSHGDFYASTAVERLGLDPKLDGLVRAGCACYTTEEEIDRLVEGVERRKG